jgi:ribosomal protein S27E
MIVFCPTCGGEIARSEAEGGVDCERCGDRIEHPEGIPTFGDIAQALDEIEKKLADLSQGVKF